MHLNNSDWRYGRQTVAIDYSKNMIGYRIMYIIAPTANWTVSDWKTQCSVPDVIPDPVLTGKLSNVIGRHGMEKEVLEVFRSRSLLRSRSRITSCRLADSTYEPPPQSDNPSLCRNSKTFPRT